MKKMILLLIVLALPVLASAQPRGRGRQNMKPRREQIEMLRIWKMTEELELTEVQADKFFPRLRLDDKKIQELEKERQTHFRELHAEAVKGGLEEKVLDNKIERISEIESKILRNKVQFIKNMDDLLSTDQRAKLMVFRHRFRERMETMMRDAMKDRQMMKNGKRR